MAGFDPTQVPTAPVEVDWSHPLAANLACLFIPGYSLHDLAQTGLSLAWGSAGAIGATSRGPSAWNNSTSISSDALATPQAGIPASIVGGNEFTVVASTHIFGAPAANAVFFSVNYSSSGSAPYVVWDLGTNSSQCYSFFINNGGTFNGNSQSTTLPSIGPAFLVGTCQIGGNTNLYLNNSLLLSEPASSPSPTSTSTSNITLGSGSNSAIEFGSFYNSILTAQITAWLTAEPFAMLRPIRRRTYFVPASATFSASIRAPRAFASVQFSASESQTVAVTAKPARAAIVTAVGPGLTLTAADRKATAAASLTASDGLMASGSVQKTTAAIDARAGLAAAATV